MTLAAGHELFKVVDDVFWLEHQDITFQCVEYYLRGVAHQGSRESRSGDSTDDRYGSLKLVAYARDQGIRGPFLDVQLTVRDVEFGLKFPASVAVTGFDRFLKLKRGISGGQHRRRMSADHMQCALGERGNLVAIVDDAGV